MLKDSYTVDEITNLDGALMCQRDFLDAEDPWEVRNLMLLFMPPEARGQAAGEQVLEFEPLIVGWERPDDAALLRATAFGDVMNHPSKGIGSVAGHG